MCEEDPIRHVLEAAGIDFPVRKGDGGWPVGRRSTLSGRVDNYPRGCGPGGEIAGGQRTAADQGIVRAVPAGPGLMLWVEQRCVPQVFEITHKFSLVFLSALMAAIDWDDEDLLDEMALGLTITGMAKPSLAPDLARLEPRVEEEAFWTRHDKIMASNEGWLQILTAKLERRGRAAEKDPIMRDRLRDIEMSVEKDIAAGAASVPRDMESLMEAYVPDRTGAVRVVSASWSLRVRVSEVAITASSHCTARPPWRQRQSCPLR